MSLAMRLFLGCVFLCALGSMQLPVKAAQVASSKSLSASRALFRVMAINGTIETPPLPDLSPDDSTPLAAAAGAGAASAVIMVLTIVFLVRKFHLKHEAGEPNFMNEPVMSSPSQRPLGNNAAGSGNASPSLGVAANNGPAPPQAAPLRQFTSKKMGSKQPDETSTTRPKVPVKRVATFGASAATTEAPLAPVGVMKPGELTMVEPSISVFKDTPDRSAVPGPAPMPSPLARYPSSEGATTGSATPSHHSHRNTDDRSDATMLGCTPQEARANKSNILAALSRTNTASSPLALANESSKVDPSAVPRNDSVRFEMDGDDDLEASPLMDFNFNKKGSVASVRAFSPSNASSVAFAAPMEDMLVPMDRNSISTQHTVALSTATTSPALSSSSSPTVYAAASVLSAPIYERLPPSIQPSPVASDDPATAKGWQQFQDSQGNTYYYNSITKVTQWAPPAGFQASASSVAAPLSSSSLSPLSARPASDSNASKTHSRNPTTDSLAALSPRGIQTALMARFMNRNKTPTAEESTERALFASTAARPLTTPSAQAPTEEAPLPAGWQEFTEDSTGVKYYYHAASGTSSWNRPTAE